MKNIKIVTVLLLAAALVIGLSACEIKREGNTETNTNSYETGVFVNDDDLEGQNISDMLYGAGTDYQIWNADNGDIYAFNSLNSFYLKSGDSVYYGAYRMTTSDSSMYYALLEIMCDNDSSINETFNVTMENGNFTLHRSSSDEAVVITKKAADEAASDESQSINQGTQSIYEVMGLSIYYLSLEELKEGDMPALKVSAAPASYTKNEDGLTSYSYDAENAVSISLGEDTNIYMPDVENPSAGNSGCDIYQMKDCFDALGSFYAVLIWNGENVEAVQYFYTAE